MIIKDKRIDRGNGFDWGRVSSDYAKYRDIYPQEFYNKIIDLGLCKDGQAILDIGTGTGVLPRNMYSYGAKWCSIDISAEQIEQAKRLSDGMNIDYYVSSAENAKFPDNSFDVATACQCYWYFDHEKLAPKLFDMIKPDGYVVFLCMEWLPFEDKIAGASEDLVLKYNPNWSGNGSTMQPISIPQAYKEKFRLAYHSEYKLKVHFTRESWNGRMKACRGIGASLNEKEINLWEQEHMALLGNIAPYEFDVLHYVAMAVMKTNK